MRAYVWTLRMIYLHAHFWNFPAPICTKITAPTSTKAHTNSLNIWYDKILNKWKNVNFGLRFWFSTNCLEFFKFINFSIWPYVKKGDSSELCFIEGVNGFYMSYFTSCLTLCPKCIGLFSAVHVLLSW